MVDAPLRVTIVIRRELPPSRDVDQHRRPPGRHIMSTRMLRAAASPPGPERSTKVPSCLRRHPVRALFSNRPHKPRQFPRHGDRGDLAQLTPTQKTPELAVQPILCPPGDPEDFGRNTLAPLPELGAGRVAVAVAPRGLDPNATQMRIPGFRDGAATCIRARAVAPKVSMPLRQR